MNTWATVVLVACVVLAVLGTLQVMARLLAMDYLADHLAKQAVEPFGWPVRAVDVEQAREYLRRTLLPWSVAGFTGWMALLLVALLALDGRLG